MGFDLVFKHANVIDGSGDKPYAADVGILGERIAAIGDLSQAETPRWIDTRGRVLCPAFIDVHSHMDLAVCQEDHERAGRVIRRQRQ
jgi:N-acyl-D-amino-acid deacylase